MVVTLHHEVREWLRAAGLNVPRHVGLVHLDRVADLQDRAGMSQNHEGVGYAAIDTVIGHLHRNEVGVPPFQKCTFTNSTWIPGATARPLRMAEQMHSLTSQLSTLATLAARPRPSKVIPLKKTPR